MKKMQKYQKEKERGEQNISVEQKTGKANIIIRKSFEKSTKSTSDKMYLSKQRNKQKKQILESDLPFNGQSDCAVTRPKETDLSQRNCVSQNVNVELLTVVQTQRGHRKADHRQDEIELKLIYVCLTEVQYKFYINLCCHPSSLKNKSFSIIVAWSTR